jgi:DNA-binding SARP family transcriptional activator
MAALLASLTEQVQSAAVLVQDLSAQIDAYRAGPARGAEIAPVLPRTREPIGAAAGPAPAPRMSFHCLGPFEAYWDDEPIFQLRTGKGRAILKYLAARPRQPVLRDVLLEMLWPETDPDVANNRLRVALHHLRQVCTAVSGEGGDCVVFRDGGYMLNPRAQVWTDVDAFEAAWRAGVRHERADQPAQAIAVFAQALPLYRGDYLEEDPFEEWTLLRREELKDVYLTMLGKLSDHWLQVGELEQATEGWTKILAKDPCREDAYRQLMLCCTKRGQRALALRWYDLCVQFLREQLHVEPEPATVALYRSIRAGDVSLGASPAAFN